MPNGVGPQNILGHSWCAFDSNAHVNFATLLEYSWRETSVPFCVNTHVVFSTHLQQHLRWLTYALGARSDYLLHSFAVTLSLTSLRCCNNTHVNLFGLCSDVHENFFLDCTRQCMYKFWNTTLQNTCAAIPGVTLFPEITKWKHQRWYQFRAQWIHDTCINIIHPMNRIMVWFS